MLLLALKTEDLRGFFFGIERLSSGFALVIANPDGEIIHQQSTTNENINLSAKLQIKISINGDIEVSANDILYSFKIDDYEGLVGLMSYATNNSVTHGKGAYIKSFKLYRNNYYKRNAADLFLNFDGIKKTYLEDIDEYINDYYIPKKDFDIGTNVSLSKWTKKDNGNGKLEFNNATGTSFFGPKNLYKDFVVKFDVEINSLEVPYGGCVGIKFGNSINGMNIDNSKSLGIGYYPDETGTYYTVPYATNMDYTPEARHSFVDEDDQQIDFFKDQNKFTLMFVARNNTVSLHYLLEGEDEANLGIVRTSVICKENETTDGHLSVYGSYGISFSIDNLSIINLDYDSPATTYAGESNYQEVTRLDFTSSEDISGLTVDNTKFNRNRLRINEDGNISTSKLVSDNLLRLKIGSVESELEIKQGNLVIKLVNDTRPYISIVDNDLNQKYDLDSSFSFEGAVFEIERLNNRLIIRFVSGEDALSLLDNQVIEFKVSIASFDNLIITSLNGFADLEAFTFINLNKYATFVSRDYDEATDYFDPWPVKESMTGSSSGCAGSIEGTSFLLMTIALIGIITISVRRRTIRK